MKVELLDINPTEKYHPKDRFTRAAGSAHTRLASGRDGPCFELCLLCRPEAKGQHLVVSSILIGISCMEVLPSSF